MPEREARRVNEASPFLPWVQEFFFSGYGCCSLERVGVGITSLLVRETCARKRTDKKSRLLTIQVFPTTRITQEKARDLERALLALWLLGSNSDYREGTPCEGLPRIFRALHTGTDPSTRRYPCRGTRRRRLRRAM